MATVNRASYVTFCESYVDCENEIRIQIFCLIFCVPSYTSPIITNDSYVLQLRKTCQLYAENAFERLNYFIDAISAQDNTTARDLISQAMSLSKAGAKLLQSIRKNMVS